jgi:diaminopimelate decarboxylase
LLISEYSKIRSEIGSCFYLANTEQFIENYHLLLNAFQRYYSKTKIAYSYKTNYLPSFCKAVLNNGGFAEVVSSMEAELALRIGVPPEKIFFNGPFKDKIYLQQFLRLGGTVNIDSFEELLQIIEISKNLKSKCSVGLRCNFNIFDGTVSRFGFDAEDNTIRKVLNRILTEPYLDFTGLHCHFASRTQESWKNAAIQMCAFISTLTTKQKKSLKYVSLGGGLHGDMHQDLRNQFSQSIPSFEDYAAVSARAFSMCVEENQLGDVTLIIEPGTALSANALEFITEIQAIKSIRGEVYVTTNGSSFNLGTAKSNVNLPFEIINFSSKDHMVDLENAKVVGYTCIESDILNSSFSGSAAVGDLIVFKEAGSYSIVMKPPFILPNVAIVEIDAFGDQYKILKRPETFMDIFSSYDMQV